MLEYLFNLQLFGEGGDGGDGGADGAAEGVDNSGEDIPAHIPERARGFYKKAMELNKPAKVEEPQPTTPVEEPKKLSYAELIKSDDYKEEHKAYMDKTIKDRFKKYEGLEESNKKMNDALVKVANKYGLDASSETFMDDLMGKIDADNSYYEDYAMQHDIGTEEAKEILDLKNQMAMQKREEMKRKAAEEEFAKQEEMRMRFESLKANAEKVKEIYPSFNLELEMQNPKFVQLCATTNEDVLTAYRAIHHDELMRAQGLAMSQRAAQQVANTIAANKARPVENGLSSQAASVSTTDWSKASLSQLRAQAEAWRRGER